MTAYPPKAGFRLSCRDKIEFQFEVPKCTRTNPLHHLTSGVPPSGGIKKIIQFRGASTVFNNFLRKSSGAQAAEHQPHRDIIVGEPISASKSFTRLFAGPEANPSRPERSQDRCQLKGKSSLSRHSRNSLGASIK